MNGINRLAQSRVLELYFLTVVEHEHFKTSKFLGAGSESCHVALEEATARIRVHGRDPICPQEFVLHQEAMGDEAFGQRRVVQLPLLFVCLGCLDEVGLRVFRWDGGRIGENKDCMHEWVGRR